MAVLMTRMFPGILLCIPFYIIMKQLQLIDSYVGLIMMYCSFTLPFAIWNTCAFFNTVHSIQIMAQKEQDTRIIFFFYFFCCIYRLTMLY